MRAALASVVVALLAACSAPEEGPLMRPGQDCLGCHDGRSAREWTAAGTWSRGSNVTITDSAGKVVALRGNDVGNFYTAEPLALPLHVSVDGKVMPNAVTYGGCNLCHGGLAGPVGPLMAPGQDCLTCHDGARAARWTVAGTWGRSAGVTVQLTDARGKAVSLTTNSVGNFYTSEPLTFPLTARAGGSQMPAGVTYGGCNRCHGAGGGAD